MHPEWLKQFPALDPGGYPECRRLIEAAQIVTFEQGTALFHDGDLCSRYLLVLEGSIRVRKISESGHEIVLYHIEPGQSCELTTACLIGGKRYPAEAVCETRVRAVSIPRTVFQETMMCSPRFRDFVFSCIDKGVTDLVRLVEDVAFGHMDARLAHSLLHLAGERESLAITHHELAAELGTAREVISRLLKEFEHHDWVRLGRGVIDIRDRKALATLASEHKP